MRKQLHINVRSVLKTISKIVENSASISKQKSIKQFLFVLFFETQFHCVTAPAVLLSVD